MALISRLIRNSDPNEYKVMKTRSEVPSTNELIKASFSSLIDFFKKWYEVIIVIGGISKKKVVRIAPTNP